MALSLHRLHRLLFLATCLVVTVAPRSASSLTLTRDPSIWLRTESSVTIAWQTDAPAKGRVLYGLTDALGRETEPSSPSSRNPSITVTELLPGTRYYYQVVTDGQTRSEMSSFETAPTTPEPFRFVAFGDIGRATGPQRRIASRIEALQPDLALLTGDIVYENGEASNFTPQYFDVYRRTIAGIPFYPSLGNHDLHTSNGRPYLDAFYLPEGPGDERYYSFDYSNAHFVALEVTEENQIPGAAMLAWLEDDLARSVKTWKIVFFHVPMHSNLGSHGDDRTIASALEPIFNAHGVDLVLQGHNHFYSRTHPIANGIPVTSSAREVTNPGAPIYVVAGGGGMGLSRLGPPGLGEAFARSAHHVVSVDVSENRLALSAIDADGTVFDAVTLIQDGCDCEEAVPGSGSLALAAGAVSPNPSSGAMFFRFRQSEASDVRVALYDVAGRKVRELCTDGPLQPGTNAIRWDGRDDRGNEAPVGVYLARIQAGSRAVTAKVIRVPPR